MSKPNTVSQKISDEDLLNEDLRITDPMSQPNLVMTIPEGVSLVEIENVYEAEGYPEKKVHCAYCGRRKHKRGFTVKLSNYKRALLGSKCGRDQFGDDWNIAKRNHDRLKERQIFLHWMQRAEDVLPDVIRELRKWETPIRILDISRGKLNASFPELASALQTNQDGALKLVEWTSEAVRKRNPQAPQFIEKIVGRCDGIEFVRVSAPLLKDYECILKDLCEVRRRISSGERIDNRDIKSLRRKASPGRLLRFVEINEAAKRFCDPANLKQIAAWAQMSGDVKEEIRFENGALVRDGKSYERPNFNDMELTPINLLESIKLK